MPSRRPVTSLIGGLLVAVALAGCGGAARRTHSATTRRAAAATTFAHTSTAPTVATICSAAAETVVKRMLGAAPSVRGSMANTGYPQCAMRVAAPGHRVVDVVVEVDTETSAYAVLERTTEEASQVWPARLQPAPIQVRGLGLDASWFANEQHLMTTDAVRLITVGVTWPHAPLGRKIALTKAVARTYLGRLEPALARGPAP